jgi:hypothetical protein
MKKMIVIALLGFIVNSAVQAVLPSILTPQDFGQKVFFIHKKLQVNDLDGDTWEIKSIKGPIDNLGMHECLQRFSINEGELEYIAYDVFGMNGQDIIITFELIKKRNNFFL